MSASAARVPADAETVKLGLAAEMLHSGCPVQLRAFGSSMLPSIWPGDLLTMASCQPGDIAMGDIICFARSGRFVIHRVAAAHLADGRMFWVTRGDALARADEPVAEEQLLGRVVAMQRNGRVLYPTRRLSRIAYCVGRLLDVKLFRSAAFRLRALLTSVPLSESKLETSA